MRFHFSVPMNFCFEIEADDPITALEKAKSAVSHLDSSDYPVNRVPHVLFPAFQTAGVTFGDMLDENAVAEACNCDATTKTPGSWHAVACSLYAD